MRSAALVKRYVQAAAQFGFAVNPYLIDGRPARQLAALPERGPRPGIDQN